LKIKGQKRREKVSMKWENRGHELDAVSEQYLAVKTLYIWGTGSRGTDCINFLEWLKIDTDFTIYFVDSKPEKQGTVYRGHKVLSPDELFARYDAESAVVSSNEEISGILGQHKVPYFDLAATNHEKHLFIQHFLCTYMLYKYDKLLSHWMDYNSTLRCNLNCDGCLNLNNEIENPREQSLDDFKQHIDAVFEKIDLCYSFHFSGGEPFLSKELPDIMHYLADNYGSRIYDKFVITNGTILPSDNLLNAMRPNAGVGGYWVFIDDYRGTVPLAQKRIPEIEKRLCDYGISYKVVRVNNWYNLKYGTEKYYSYDDIAMIYHRDNCNTFLQNFEDGRIYSCCYEAFAYKAGLIDHVDFLDIRSASKAEILEYRLGYTQTGYVDMCRHCQGIGEDTSFIKPAVQIPRKHKIIASGKTQEATEC